MRVRGDSRPFRSHLVPDPPNDKYPLTRVNEDLRIPLGGGKVQPESEGTDVVTFWTEGEGRTRGVGEGEGRPLGRGGGLREDADIAARA